jgi:hypothetical protein
MLIFIFLMQVAAEWNCLRPWPQLELFMPFRVYPNNNPRFWEVETIYLQTYLFFWPVELSKTSLVLVYDKEDEASEHVRILNGTINEIKQHRDVEIQMKSMPQSPYYRGGHDRQQYLMFWADNYSNSEYIGYVDSDAAFITYVDREDLFEDEKPVVNARSGFHAANDGTNNWSIGTYNTLKVLEPFRCMAYFPFIIHRKHLQEMREYISQLHNMSFGEVFYQIMSSNSFSQFNVMCTYLYYHHRDEYKWYVQIEQPDWDGVTPPTPYGQDSNMSKFTPEMRKPKPRIATHVRYRGCPRCSVLNFDANKHIIRYYNFLLMGYCYGPPFPHNETKCQNETKPYDYYYEMYNFEYIDYTKLNTGEDLSVASTARYERIKHCQYEYKNKGLLDTVLRLG